MNNLSENIKSIQQSQEKIQENLIIIKYLNQRKQENLDKMNELVQEMLQRDAEWKQLMGGVEE